ncbi:multicopper oxidase domain-containing protein [Algoriphagus sp.]|uniref:multicopper oxidase domain-containing protein n=1 Tax=Algoriphagus sp. TaxID=1872435 RepID=UPI00391A5EA6
MNRRKFIRISSLSGGFVTFGGLTWMLQSCHNMDMDMVGKYVGVIEGKFDWELLIPPSQSASSTSLTSGLKTAQLMQEKSAQVFGYQNGILGPTLHVTKGEQVTIRFLNQSHFSVCGDENKNF